MNLPNDGNDTLAVWIAIIALDEQLLRPAHLLEPRHKPLHRSAGGPQARRPRTARSDRLKSYDRRFALSRRRTDAGFDRPRGATLRAAVQGIADSSRGRRRVLRGTRSQGFARRSHPDHQHQRSLLVRLSAALQSRRRGARSDAELSALRLSG